MLGWAVWRGYESSALLGGVASGQLAPEPSWGPGISRVRKWDLLPGVALAWTGGLRGLGGYVSCLVPAGLSLGWVGMGVWVGGLYLGGIPGSQGPAPNLSERTLSPGVE